VPYEQELLGVVVADVGVLMPQPELPQVFRARVLPQVGRPESPEYVHPRAILVELERYKLRMQRTPADIGVGHGSLAGLGREQQAFAIADVLQQQAGDPDWICGKLVLWSRTKSLSIAGACEAAFLCLGVSLVWSVVLLVETWRRRFALGRCLGKAGISRDGTFLALRSPQNQHLRFAHW